jgi:predicted Zn-dependent protease with MMP-like domain
MTRSARDRSRSRGPSERHPDRSGADARVSRRAFNRLVEEALDGLPDELAELLENVAVVVEEEPSPETLRELDMDPDDELFGLYQGVPLTDRDSFYQSLPDRISIYRGPLLRACRSRREIVREIRDTVAHEIGHHFGLDDDDMPY